MQNERHIICGGLTVRDRLLGGVDALRLVLHGDNWNGRLRVPDLTKNLVTNVPAAFLDLVEVATYVYIADQAIKRGTYKLDDMQPLWRRRLLFDIPVRDPDLWNSDGVRSELSRTLGFLSDDSYEFHFHTFKATPPTPEAYFPFSSKGLGTDPERVVLFSGGLDSLGGAIKEVVTDRAPVFLLTHESTQKLRQRHRTLREQIDSRAGKARPTHVTIRVNKKKGLSKDYTQRGRSFLYASLAAAVARMSGLDTVRFYENGVVSSNLPLAEDVVGGRATRTTHPMVLNGFARIFSVLSEADGGRPIGVENAFFEKTKADVVRFVLANDCGSMIETTTSCTHTWTWTHEHTHCGVCSQCIDRRFAVLAANAVAFDPSTRYAADLLLDPRPKDEDIRLVAGYVETARVLSKISAADFKESFGQVFRLAQAMSGSIDDNIAMLHDLHLRHGQDVSDVMAAALAQHSQAILNRTLAPNCLLQLVHDQSIPAEGMVGVSEVERTKSGVDTTARFIFRRAEKAWEYRFNSTDSRLRIITRPKGAAYLHALLSNPNREFSVAKLVLEVANAPVGLINTAPSTGDDVLDDAALGMMWSEYQEHQGAIEEAERYGREGEAQQLREEQESFLKQLNAAQYQRRSKRSGDDRERHRKSLVTTINRTIKDLRQFDGDFADHLKRHLKLGSSPCYSPPDGVDWVTY